MNNNYTLILIKIQTKLKFNLFKSSIFSIYWKFAGRKSSTPEAPDKKLRMKDRKSSRSLLNNKSPKKSVSKPALKVDQEDEEDIYGGLDASKSVIIHGIESDWIEEEMSDDDDFRL